MSGASLAAEIIRSTDRRPYPDERVRTGGNMPEEADTVGGRPEVGSGAPRKRTAGKSGEGGGVFLADSSREAVGTGVGSMAFIQVQMVAFIVVFMSSGLVPIDDILFALFTSLYILFLVRFAFPSPPSSRPPPRVFSGNRFFQLHVATGALIGMFLPFSFILGSFAKGDHAAVEGATPHLFLLSCQILTENLVVDMKSVSLPVRALLPILYNTRRLTVLAAWNRSFLRSASALLATAGAATSAAAAAASLAGGASESGGGLGPGTAAGAGLGGAGFVGSMAAKAAKGDFNAWVLFGRVVAALNMVFWSINLFGFLIPVFLPRAFRKHFELEAAAKREKKAQ